MRRLILHIGTPKTGSTSLQEVLAAGRPGLAKSGVYYPRKIGPVNHIALADALLDPERRRLGPATNRKAHEIREALMLNAFAAEINGLPSSIHTVVISNESFCFKAASAAEFAKLKEILEPHFDVIEIVIYLRRQDEHYASIYGQGLRQGLKQAAAKGLIEVEYADQRPAGAKAQSQICGFSAQPKSCPFALQASERSFPQAVKSCLFAYRA